MNNYYSIPLKFDSIFDCSSSPITTCTEQQSIDEFLELLITTCPGEHKFDSHFGCRIWDMDFERVISQLKWESECASIIAEMINQYEPRLKDVSVKTKIIEIAKSQRGGFRTPMIKKKVDIFIKAALVSTGEYFQFYYNIYMGPISSE